MPREFDKGSMLSDTTGRGGSSSGLIEALNASTRETRWGTVPDPVAREVLNSRSIHDLDRELAALGMKDLQPLSAGASSVVLQTGGKVVRVGVGEPAPRPNIPEVLQAEQSGSVGYLRYEVLPRVETHGITPADVQQLHGQLKSRGYEWGDAGPDNAGKLDGRLVVTDPGGISRADPGKVLISDNDLHRLYRAVEVADISRTARQDTPTAIMTGGQPGSGKTGLTGIALQELASRGGAVVIDADRMREYNPDYRRLMASDPERAADLTHPTAAQWANQLRERAIFERRNLIVDGTMRDPEDVARVSRQLKDAGYIIDARVMAVPGDVSFAHARLRYEALDNEAQAGRVVNQAQHDQAYVGIPKSLERLEADKLVDRITIYDTARREVYQNTLEGGQWKSPPEAAKTLVAVRERGRTHDERAEFVEALATVEAQTGVRNSVSPGRGPQDRADWTARLDAARKDLAEFEKSAAFARAKAFDDGPSAQTLARHPELDAAYKQLADLRKGFSPETPDAERDRQYAAAVAHLSEQLHRGEVPKGDVGPEDSRRVINAAARERNLVVREPEPDRIVQGEVLARSSQHTLVHVAGSDNVAIVYTRAQLERDIEPGEKLGFAHEQHGTTRVMTQQQAQEMTDFARDRDTGMERSR